MVRPGYASDDGCTRQWHSAQSIRANIVSDDAFALREWLLALGFTEDLDPGLHATAVHELVDQTDYPSRDFTVADPDGNHWTFATFAG